MHAFITVAVFLVTTGLVMAAPPANDSLANATVLTGTSGSTAATVAEATRQTGEPLHGFNPLDTVERTVWFEWTALESKPVKFSVSNAGFDPAMAVYTGAGFPLVTVSLNNNTLGNLPEIEFIAVSGTSYKIAVGSFAALNVPSPDFTFEWSQTTSPTNDNWINARVLEGIAGVVTSTTGGATTEPSEPVFGSGTSTVWFKFTNNTGHNLSMTVSTRRSMNPSFDTTLAVYDGSSLASMFKIQKNDNMPATFKSQVTFRAQEGNSLYLAVNRSSASPDGNILLDWNVTPQPDFTDYGTRIGDDREVVFDEASDIAVFRPQTGIWYRIDSSNNAFHATQFGIAGDVPVPADYDGDGFADIAVTRSVGGLKYWYLRSSYDEPTTTIIQWGLADDKEMPGDYDADGLTDLAVFRPSTGTWYVHRTSSTQPLIVQFGLPGDIPVRGDFKNTAFGTDIAVFRPSNGTWYVFDGANAIVTPFGLAGDRPVPSDYDFDGKTDIAVWRPSTGVWHMLQRTGYVTQAWGTAGDIPMTGNFDNNSNRKADHVVFRPSIGTWYLLTSELTQTRYQPFGLSGDIPVSSLTNLMQ